MSDTPHSRAYDACNLLDQIHGEMRFLTVAVTKVIDDDQIANGCNAILDRITRNLEYISSEWWELQTLIPRTPAAQSSGQAPGSVPGSGGGA